MADDASQPLPTFRYEDLLRTRLEHALETCGEVQIVLDRKRTRLFAELIELQRRHHRLQFERHTAGVRFREALRAAWFIAKLSLFHPLLFEAQSVAFELASSFERQERSEEEVVFRFVK